MNTQELHIDGHKLVARALNPNTPGIPFILLHGITLSVNAWDTDAVLRQYGPCYSLSLPGHYPATMPPDFNKEMITPEMIGQVLGQAIKRLVGETPVVLVGHSTGGFAALATAAVFPALARGIVCLGAFARGKWTGVYGMSQTLARHSSVGRLLSRTTFKVVMSNPFLYRLGWHTVANSRSLNAYPERSALLESTYQNAKHIDMDSVIDYFSVMPDIDISPLLKQITAPTIAITGDKDPVVPPEQSKLIAATIPNGQAVIVKGGGHFLFFETPDEYNTILNNWLQKLIITGGS